MNRMLFSLLGLLATALLASAVQEGQTREDVIAELGRPKGEAKARGLTQMLYPGGVIELTSGRVSRIEGGFDPNVRAFATPAVAAAAAPAAPVAAAAPSAPPAKDEPGWMAKVQSAVQRVWVGSTAPRENPVLEKVKADGEVWMAQASNRAAAARAAYLADQAARITDVRGRGQAIDLTQYVRPGKITIVDFHADWCGPCQQMKPFLESLVGLDTNVVLVKIDIVDWSSPVAQQFGINRIPRVQVYNRNGQEVGSPTSDGRQIRQAIEQALH